MRRRTKATNNKSGHYHLNVPLSEWEAEHIDKYCSVHGSKVALVRALLRRYFREMELIEGGDKLEPNE